MPMPVIQVSRLFVSRLFVSGFVVAVRVVSGFAVSLSGSAIGGCLAREADARRNLRPGGTEFGIGKRHDAEGDFTVGHGLAVHLHGGLGHGKSRSVVNEARRD